MEETSITNFSHEHPLSFFQMDAEFEDPKPHRCHICALPILAAPSYTCNHPNCNHFFVHEACTQLPKSFYHKLHQKTLYLTKPARVGESFTYEFENSSGLHLHPLVAKPVEIKSQHISHIIAHHQLALLCREILCRCDVCGKQEKGFFFYCKECGFFVHQDCTVLPSVMKLPSHPHPFILAYSLPYVPSKPTDSVEYNNKCSICDGVWLLPDGGVYFCGECYALAHVSCAKPKMENVIADTEFVHLPKEEDTMVIRSFVQKNNPAASSSSTQIIEKNYHKHPLILEDACSSRDDNVGVCDVCIQPCCINNTSRCGEFVAHPLCAHLLPPRFELVFGPVRWELLLRGHDELAQSFFNSVFCCHRCQRLSNGFSYTMSEKDQRRGLMYDLECAVAPKTMKHASHKQHILFLTGSRWISEANCRLSCCTDAFRSIYRCVVCEYSIHIMCALLPKTTRHKFDDHPLHLIMNTPPPLGHFCEVCEQQMDQLKGWYYACPKCDQYFHIGCIPSVGYLSRVKFGKTHFDHKLHHHPLTLTRMLTHQRNESCGHCNETIEGFSNDEMALHCSPCHFWLHFFCAAAAANWPKRRCNREALQFYR